MLRKWGTLVLLLLAAPMLASAQNTGKIAGVVIDGSTGDPMPGANVVLEGTQLGTTTDLDGNYFIIGVPVGTYDIQASFVGYQPQTFEGVEVSANYTRELNFELTPGVELDEIVVEYERPIIQKDAVGVAKVVTSEDLQNLPVRGVANIAALQGGVVSDETSSDLYIRGGREEEVAYYVDGVRVVGQVAVPTLAVQEQEMLIGSIPARYGDAMSGIISITTKSGGANFFGSLEAITSEVLDAYGYNNVSATLGGPLVSEKVNFFLSGELLDQKDANPRAFGFPRLSEEMFDFIQQNPQSVGIYNPDTDEYGYLPFPGNLADSVSLEEVEAMLEGQLPEGFEYVGDHPTPTFAPSFFTAEDLTREDARPNNDSRSWTLNGNVNINPVDPIRIRLGGGYEQRNGNESLSRYMIYAYNRFRKQDRQTYRFYGGWTHYLSNATFYQIQAEYSDYKGWNYMQGFSKNVEDVLFYGDISHPSNAVTARYREYQEIDTDGDGEVDQAVYVPLYGDGNLPDDLDVRNNFAPPGVIGTLNYVDAEGFEKFRNQRIGIRANATTQLGVHQIEFGGEYEQRTSRFYRSENPWALARYYDDGDVEGGDQAAVSQYYDLPFDVLDTDVWYYGYNYLGTEEVDNQDVEAFANTGLPNDQRNFNMEPYRPIYYAGYISDKLEYRDLVLQVGVRVDVFDNNALIPKDRFALFPIVRAGDVGGSVPENIGSDYAVYFNESSGNVVGYRDLDGNFYNANGEGVAAADIRNAGAPRVRQDENGNELRRLTPDVFTDYEPQVTFQPRIGVSFPVTDQALFYASYDVVTQRPSERVYETIESYQQTTEQSERVQNPALEPEKTIQYELGFRQRVGARAALQLSGFYRQIQNKINLRIVQNAFPVNYQTYENVDFGTVKGVEFEFDLRRTNNVQFNANYTLSFAQGTGADSRSTVQIVWRQETAPFYPRFISPLDFDQRHRINFTIDYRLGQGEGPVVGGAHFLENFGFNLTGTLASGQPYTRRDDPTPIYTSFNGFLLGSINGENEPWSSLLNLRVDRRFPLGNANLVAYLWVQNLLDVNNVIDVYPQTGLADDDGYLNTALGREQVAAIEATEGSLAAQSFVDHYRFRVDDPFNYGVPRQVRLGVRVDF